MARGHRKAALSTDLLLAAIPHVAHDAMLLRQAFQFHTLRVGWTTWFVMARNMAIFFDVAGSGGRKDDIRASQFFRLRTDTAARWSAAKAARLAEAPPSLGDLHSHASQAVAHLSWMRVRQPEVQTPSRAVTKVLQGLWGDFAQCAPEPYRAEIRRAWRALHPRPRKADDD